MKKILMFDSSHGYLAFIKRKFKTEFEVTSYEKADVSELDIESFDSAIFIINDERELVDLMYVYTKVDSLFIWSNFKKLNQQLIKLDNIVVLNLNQSKNKIAEQLRFWMDLPKSNQYNKKSRIDRVSA